MKPVMELVYVLFFPLTVVIYSTFLLFLFTLSCTSVFGFSVDRSLLASGVLVMGSIPFSCISVLFH